MINSTTHNREEKKYKNWRKKFKELYLEKESTDVWNRREEGTCVNLFRVTNEHTPENQVKWVDEIYNSIFTFKKDVLIEING